MNICIINPTRIIRPGIIGLSKHLESRNHKVIILTPTKPEKYELEGLNSVSIEVYPSIFIPKIRYTIPNFLTQLIIIRKLVQRENIDLIHIWTYFYAAVWIPFLYCKIKHVPNVITVANFPGISWHYGSRIVDFIAKLYSVSMGRVLLRGCSKVILLNSSAMQGAHEIGIKVNKLLVIPNGVEPASTGAISSNTDIRKGLGIEDNQRMILNVGRLVPVKGIDTLIKITEQLLDDGYNVKTVIVGDGPYRKQYEESARYLGKNIVFTGFRSDISELMVACDVFVLPSLAEGLPNVLLEAAICSKPIVASNTGGVSDIIIHGKTGLLAQPKDVKTFVHYIEMVLTNTGSLKLGAQAKKHVEDNFQWQSIVDKLEKVYESLLIENNEK